MHCEESLFPFGCDIARNCNVPSIDKLSVGFNQTRPAHWVNCTFTVKSACVKQNNVVVGGIVRDFQIKMDDV